MIVPRRPVRQTAPLLILPVFLLFLAQPARSQLSVRPSTGKAHTTVRLVADVKTVRPGDEFTVGVLLTMDKGWHTYWKNAGEAGLPTSVSWHLPVGVEAGELLWPRPAKHIEEGDVLTYGYATETMLLTNMRVSEGFSGTLTLRATVSWLECERICVPGSAEAALTLPVSTAPPVPDNTSLFTRYRAKIPGPVSEVHDVTVIPAAQGHEAAIRITGTPFTRLVTTGPGAPDFYPETLDHFLFGRTRTETVGDASVIHLPLSVDQKVGGAAMLRGLVVWNVEGGKTRVAELGIPFSAEFCAGLPIAAGASSAGGILDQNFSSVQGAASQSLFLYLIFAFIGGLLLNIMPCVLPVIALKVFGLVRLAGDRPGKIRALGWMFSLGILASFLALALLVIILQAAGQQVGWGFQFQEPLFVIAMSAVVFAFGLSLFGVYEIRLPGAAVSSVSAAATRHTDEGKGYVASFSEGVFATILATPCTAPFLGSALGFAFAQPWWMVLLIFTVVAAGMALPYLLLTSRPAWVKYLPKPGEWMVTAKQFMGFLMMATLIWLLYILGKQLGMEGVIWTAAFLLSVGLACWTVGRFATLTASRRKVVMAWVVALALVVGGYWLFLESILNVREVIAGTAMQSSQGTSEAGGIVWKPFALADLEAALEGDKPVFIDFTAEWCLTCKVNEKGVLADRAVVDKFRSQEIVAFRADWTNRNPDITKLLQKFGRSGVPLYVVFPTGRRTEPIVLPEVITTGIVLDALDRASAGTSVQ